MIADILCGLTKLISGLTVRWSGCFPEHKQRVYYANHTSHLDFLSIWAALPKELRGRTRPVAAKDYWDRGRLRKYLAHKVINAVLIERKKIIPHDVDDNPINLMLKVLDEGFSLIIFPEGTRNSESALQPFKSGLYHLVKSRPDVEYIPVYLENLNRILPKGEVLFIPLLGSVTFGRPLQIIDGEAKTVFLDRARAALEELTRL